MLFRRIAGHIKNQDWLAVALDFVIVVVGVFIGIQVANWNDARTEYQQETSALIALRDELQASIATTQSRAKAYAQAAAAGRRSLAFISENDRCTEDCWDRVVDFMHASQWQSLEINHSTYRNMRNRGFPKSIALSEAVDTYLAQGQSNVAAFEIMPVYRSLVRQLVGVEAQEHYWRNCFSLLDGVESYVLDCPEGISSDEAMVLANTIIQHPGIKPNLTEWIGALVSLPQTLGDQNQAAQRAIDLINKEIKRRE
ncbi:MAG: hypothetical protein AAF351_00335 [Pseudomonadota bacterium]